MIRLEDQDIGLLWAQHYPRRKDSTSSETICRLICFIARERARRLVAQSDWMAQLNSALRELGIPRDQFFAFENE
jgi:hypothetical protein